ncbi:lipase 3-like [Ceratina calcarata]|uniref:Lipase n=1 Tax=Ceratina calcarata TaxID=156304 RepID=A0AAJ7IVJ5_9HYME|nr:lipase 3-like [Ceratina calcarata]
MKDLIITFSSLWLISHAASDVISDIMLNTIPISISDVFEGTDQKNDNFNTLQIIQSQGYPAEAHTVTTEDGYILTMHRIPGKPGSPAVFLQHGILGSSADWLIVNKSQSLAFMLADHGYDVWFGNYRGNTYSRAHVNLTINDRRFWDFSWHESGIYDLPAMLTHIVETKQNLLRAYIGYSMGTTTFFVLSSERPQIARLVQSAYLLAPIAYMKYQQSPVFRFLASIDETVKKLIDDVLHGEILPNDILVKILAKYFCYSNTLEEKICSNLLFLLVGFDDTQFDYQLMPKFLNHFPAGGSTKQLEHYGQSINSGDFRQYDYGKDKNLKIYNSIEPPKYNISRIITPIAMFWGENDWLSDRRDVMRFVNELPHKPILYKVPYKKFNHIDYLMARHVRKLVFDELIDILTNNKLNLHLET